MKTWIDWMSHIAGGLLFQAGYVTSPTMLMQRRSTETEDGAHEELDACRDSPASAKARPPVVREAGFSIG